IEGHSRETRGCDQPRPRAVLAPGSHLHRSRGISNTIDEDDDWTRRWSLGPLGRQVEVHLEIAAARALVGNGFNGANAFHTRDRLDDAIRPKVVLGPDLVPRAERGQTRAGERERESDEDGAGERASCPRENQEPAPDGRGRPPRERQPTRRAPLR